MKSAFNPGYLIVTVVAILTAVVTKGCDNRVEPFDPPEDIYSIYAAFDLNTGRQYIRVNNMTTPLTEEASESLDVTVNLQHLETGITRQLPDSVVRFQDVFTHNFYTDLEVLPENSYLIEVSDNDGRVEQISALMPPLAGAEFDPVGETCDVPIEVTLGPLNGGRITPTLRIDYDDVSYRVQPLGLQQPFIDEDGREYVRLSFIPDQVISRALPFSLPCYQFDTDRIFVEFLHIGPEDDETDTIDELPVSGKRFIGFHEELESVRIDTACASYELCF
jgi:hypothetical protein